MEEYIKLIIVCVLILVLDALWIGTNINMYSKSVKLVQKSDMVVRYQYVVGAYMIVLFASLYIAIPFTKHYLRYDDSVSQKLIKSFLYGGIVGFVVYSLYNLTCLSIYKDYEFYVALLDTLWGTFLNTLVVFVYTLL